jgi:uncharacterized membrane protein
VASVRISTTVNGKSLDLYNILRDVERLPDFMSQIKKVTVLWQLPPNRQISEWEVDIEGTLFHWKQEDSYDVANRAYTFRVIEGDFCAEGRWTLSDMQTSRTRVTVESTFNWDIPNLGRYVGPELERKAKKHLIRMVASLRERMKTGASGP